MFDLFEQGFQRRTFSDNPLEPVVKGKLIIENEISTLESWERSHTEPLGMLCRGKNISALVIKNAALRLVARYSAHPKSKGDLCNNQLRPSDGRHEDLFV